MAPVKTLILHIHRRQPGGLPTLDAIGR